MDREDIDYIFNELLAEIKAARQRAHRACSSREFADEVGSLPLYGAFLSEESTTLDDIGPCVDFMYRAATAGDFKQLSNMFRAYFIKGLNKARKHCFQHEIASSETINLVDTKYLMAEIAANSFHRTWHELEYPPLTYRQATRYRPLDDRDVTDSPVDAPVALVA